MTSKRRSEIYFLLSLSYLSKSISKSTNNTIWLNCIMGYLSTIKIFNLELVFGEGRRSVDKETKKTNIFSFSSSSKIKLMQFNGQFQCLAKFLLKHEKQNQSPQLKRAYEK